MDLAEDPPVCARMSESAFVCHDRCKGRYGTSDLERFDRLCQSSRRRLAAGGRRHFSRGGPLNVLQLTFTQVHRTHTMGRPPTAERANSSPEGGQQGWVARQPLASLPALGHELAFLTTSFNSSTLCRFTWLVSVTSEVDCYGGEAPGW